MPTSNFDRPTLATLISRVQTDLEGELVGVNARLRHTVENVFARAWSGITHGLHGHISWGVSQFFPSLAAEENLVRDAALHGINRVAASAAAGNITVTGSGGDVVAGTEYVRLQDGASFTVDVTVSSINPSATVAITAAVAGQASNVDEGDTLVLVTPIADIDSDAIVASGGISGGADIETRASLQERFELHLQSPIMGGAPDDHVQWARRTAGVTRAWEYVGQDGVGNPGLGKVSLTFVRDDDTPSIVPDSGEVTTVQDYVQARSPAEVIVFAPTAVALDYTVQLKPNTAAVQAAVDAEIADLLKREGIPGGTVTLSKLNEAISIAAGEEDHVLTSPAADVTHTFGQLAIPGTATYSTLT